MFAIVLHKGKQYKFEAGKTYEIDLLDSTEKKVVFDNVLLVSDEKNIKVGDPQVKDANVEGEIIENIKGEKVQVFKFHAKKHYQRSNGHRQDYTKIKISSINA